MLESAQRLYRIRVGDFRIIYTIADQERMVTVALIGDRKEIYRDV